MKTNISNSHFGDCLITLMLISFSFVFFISDNVSIEELSGIPKFFIPFSAPCSENLTCIPSFGFYFSSMPIVSMAFSVYLFKKSAPKEFNNSGKSIATIASLFACASLFFCLLFRTDLSTISGDFSSKSASIIKIMLTEKLALAILGTPLFFSLSIVFYGLLLELSSVSSAFLSKLSDKQKKK